MVFGQQEFLESIHNLILNQSPETLSDPRFTSPEDMQSRYDHVVAGAFDALAFVLGIYNYIHRKKHWKRAREMKRFHNTSNCLERNDSGVIHLIHKFTLGQHCTDCLNACVIMPQT